MCDTTQRVTALEVQDNAISNRIVSKSQEMRAFHVGFRKRVRTSEPSPVFDEVLAEPESVG